MQVAPGQDAEQRVRMVGFLPVGARGHDNVVEADALNQVDEDVDRVVWWQGVVKLHHGMHIGGVRFEACCRSPSRSLANGNEVH